MKLIKNYLYNVSYQLIKIIIPIFTIPYISRVLGPQNIGINSYTYNIVQYFVLFGTIGIGTYGSRKVAYNSNNKKKLSRTFWEIFLLQVIMVFTAYIFFFLFLLIIKQYKIYYLAQSIMIAAAIFDISWFYMGIQEFKYTFYRNFIIRILVLVLIFSYVKTESDLIIYIVLYTGSYLIGNLSLFSYLKNYIYLPKINIKNVFRHLAPALALFLPQIAGQFYGIFNKNILGIMENVTYVGYFDQSDKITSIIIAIVTATGSVMLPYVANEFIKGNLSISKNYLYDSIEISSSISIPISFGMISLSTSFVPLFFSTKFLPVTPILMIQSISCLIVSISNVIGIQYLIPTNQNYKYTISIFIGAITNLIIDIPLIHFWGVNGSAISILFSELAVTFSQLFLVRKEISFYKLFNSSYKYFISGLIMFLFTNYLNKILQMSWISIIETTVIGVIIYTFCLYILKANIINVIKKIKNEY